jgi:hypothetical protein
MSFHCLSVSLLQPVTKGSEMDQPSYSLQRTLLHLHGNKLFGPWLAAGTEDLSAAASILHGFSLNKPGRC